MSYIKLILILVNLVILAAALYSLRIYKLLPRTIQVFTWYIFLTALIQIPYTILAFYLKNNLFLLHLDILLGFLVLALFYRMILQRFINPLIITIIAVLFSIFTIINSLFIQPYHSAINSYALTAQSLLVVIFSLSTFIVLLNDVAKETQKDIIASLHWINSGLFIYYASDLLIFYFGNFIQNSFSETINQYTWLVNCFFLSVMYICFIAGLWKHPKISTF